MKCSDCGSECKKMCGDLWEFNSVIGPFIVPGVEWDECSDEGCDGVYYSMETCEAIESAKKIIEHWLRLYGLDHGREYKSLMEFRKRLRVIEGIAEKLKCVEKE